MKKKLNILVAALAAAALSTFAACKKAEQAPPAPEPAPAPAEAGTTPAEGEGTAPAEGEGAAE